MDVINFSMRDRMEHVKGKLFPNFEHQENQRAEFLPVEWRSSLRLDGGKKKIECLAINPYLAEFLNGKIQLPFLELSIINFRDIKI